MAMTPDNSTEGLSAENAEIVRRVLPDNADWHFSECIYMAEDVEALLNSVRKERDILLKLHQDLMPVAQMRQHTARDFVDWLNLTQAAATALNAARATPPGYVLVPEEPTEAMLDAVKGSMPGWELIARGYWMAMIATRPQAEGGDNGVS